MLLPQPPKAHPKVRPMAQEAGRVGRLRALSPCWGFALLLVVLFLGWLFAYFLACYYVRVYKHCFAINVVLKQSLYFRTYWEGVTYGTIERRTAPWICWNQNTAVSPDQAAPSADAGPPCRPFQAGGACLVVGDLVTPVGHGSRWVALEELPDVDRAFLMF